jgi:hypothetical protein
LAGISALLMGCSCLHFALQGLAKFYEQQGKWENYVEVLTRLLDFSIKESVDYLHFRREADLDSTDTIDRMRLNAQRPYKSSYNYDEIMGHRLRFVCSSGHTTTHY